MRSGSLQVVTSDAAIGQNIALSGNGVLPAVSLPVTSLNFTPQIVGSTSSTQAITLNNTGDGPLSISNVTISGDFSQSSTCGNTVVPFASCTFSISFAPTATSNRSGTLTITDDASGSPHSVALSGTGTDFSLSVASGGSTSASITAGRTVTYNLQLTPVSGFFGTVTLACSGAPNLATCTVSPNSITPGNATPFSVSVSTTAASLAPPFTAPRIPPLRILPLILLACAAAFLAVLFSHVAHPCRQRPFVLVSAVALLLVCAISLASCGGSGSSNNTGPTNPGTPKGTYTLTVSGTASGQTRAITLTLAVN